MEAAQVLSAVLSPAVTERDDQRQPLSPQETVRLLKSAQKVFTPEARATLLRAAKSDISPQRTAELLRTIPTPSPSEAAATLEAIKANMEIVNPGQVAEMLRAVRVTFPAEGRGPLLDLLRAEYSPQHLREAGEAALSRSADWTPELWNARVREAEAATPPEPAEGWTLAGWLAALPLAHQLGLLTAALAAVNELTNTLEAAGDVERPEALQSATVLMLAVMFFITAIVAARGTSPPDE